MAPPQVKKTMDMVFFAMLMIVHLFRNLMLSPGIDLDQLKVIADQFGLMALGEKITERKNMK